MDVPKRYGVAEIADLYQKALDQQKAMEAALKDQKHLTEQYKESLIDAMMDEETDSIGRNGKRYTAVPKTKYSKAAGQEAQEELFQLLRESGLGDLITETVNANTLQATMRGLAEENGGELPEEWKDCIRTYNYVDISVRKM